MSFREEIINITNAKPNGVSGSYVGHCLVHKDNNPSLSIKFKENQKNPLVHCHAGCNSSDIISELKNQGLWISTDNSPSNKNNNLKSTAHTEKQIAYIRQILNESVTIEGTLAEKYLQLRGLNTEEIDTTALRFHPNVFHSNGEYLPCLIGMIQDSSSNGTGIQRIFLNKEGYKTQKNPAKKVLGSVSESFVPFLGEHTNNRVHLCEGIETAIAINSSLKELTLSLISANNLPKFNVKSFPKNTEVHIWADNDKSETGEKVAREAYRKFTELGYICAIHFPRKHPQNSQKSYDFLDQYKELGAPTIQEDLLTPSLTSKILPIKSPEYNLPSLTDEYLSNNMWTWCSLNAQKLNVPIELVAVPLLSYIGGLIGNKAAISPKKYDKSFRIFPNLWGMIIANPGSKKSPAMKQSFKFIENFQNEELKKEKETRNKNKLKIDAINTKLSKLKKQYKESLTDASKGISEEEFLNKSKELEEEMNKLIYKVDRRVINSATIEKMIDLLQHKNNGFIVFRDELSALFDQFHKKGHENDRQFYLESWAGDSSFHYDTISRGSAYIENLCLTLVGSTQPSVIKKILESALKDANDGLMQRFQVMVYPNDTQPAQFVDCPYNEKHDDKIKTLIEKLITLHTDGLIVCNLSDAAYKLYKDYFSKLECEIKQEQSDLFKSHLSKYNKLTPALCLIFHFIEQIESIQYDYHKKIEASAMEKAIQWTIFLKAHARKIYNLDYSFQAVSAFSLAEKIVQGKVIDGMSVRTIYKNGWSNLKSVDEVVEAASYLQKHNWLTIIESNNKIGRKSTQIQLASGLQQFITNNNWCA